MAHSDIFLCGHSNDAMLATKVYCVIKEKGSCQVFPWATQLSRKHPHALGLVLHIHSRTAKTKASFFAISLHWAEQTLFYSTVQCTIVKIKSQFKVEKRAFYSLSCSPPLSPLLATLSHDSTLLQGKAISRSHTWTYINVNREHSWFVFGRPSNAQL